MKSRRRQRKGHFEEKGMGHAVTVIYCGMSRLGRTKSRDSADQRPVFGRKEQLAESLKLPKDMLLGASILTMTGSHELWVENYKGIIEYTPQSIILQAKTGQISICGCGLVIDYYTNEDMKIIGDIRCVSYL